MDPGDLSALWVKYAERIEQARSREALSRISAFCPITIEEIKGFKITPMTLEKYSIISLPEFWEDDDPRIPILRFLWIMSPEFSTDPRKAKTFILENIEKNLTGLQEKIREIFEGAFKFAPPSESDKSGGQVDWISMVVDIIASEYGWTDEKILSTPMDRIFLYLKRIFSRKSADKVTFESEADRLRQEFMNIANGRN